MNEQIKKQLEITKHNLIISDAITKADSVINNSKYNKIMCSISGGSDSDIMLDIIYSVDIDKKVDYVWFDTGLEYKATKNHLFYLEYKYGIKIQRERAIKPIPISVKEYGQPFLSKYVSTHIERLQKVGFNWQDEPFEVLMELYPHSIGSLKWWCNKNKETFLLKNPSDPSKFDINRYKYLKQFLISNPPSFKISSKCCEWAKKKPSIEYVKKNDLDLTIIGVRKNEGGIRSSAYKNCYSIKENGVDQYRPLFWFTNSDKEEYEKLFNIKHSDCYCRYGYKRTGCVCCPYGSSLNYELDVIRIEEPYLYMAATTIFKDSYEYTKKYRKFVKDMDDSMKGRKRLF